MKETKMVYYHNKSTTKEEREVQSIKSESVIIKHVYRENRERERKKRNIIKCQQQTLHEIQRVTVDYKGYSRVLQDYGWAEQFELEYKEIQNYRSKDYKEHGNTNEQKNDDVEMQRNAMINAMSKGIT